MAPTDLASQIDAHQVDRHVLRQVLAQHGVRGLEVTEMGRDERARLRPYRDLAEVGGARVRPGADPRLGAEIDRGLRERAFVDEELHRRGGESVLRGDRRERDV